MGLEFFTEFCALQLEPFSALTAHSDQMPFRSRACLSLLQLRGFLGTTSISPFAIKPPKSSGLSAVQFQHLFHKLGPYWDLNQQEKFIATFGLLSYLLAETWVSYWG